MGIISAIGDKCLRLDKDYLEPIGSWTAFMKSVKTHKAVLEYFEVVS